MRYVARCAQIPPPKISSMTIAVSPKHPPSQPHVICKLVSTGSRTGWCKLSGFRRVSASPPPTTTTPCSTPTPMHCAALQVSQATGPHALFCLPRSAGAGSPLVCQDAPLLMTDLMCLVQLWECSSSHPHWQAAPSCIHAYHPLTPTCSSMYHQKHLQPGRCGTPICERALQTPLAELSNMSGPDPTMLQPQSRQRETWAR